jgi:hypothetical protein
MEGVMGVQPAMSARPVRTSAAREKAHRRIVHHPFPKFLCHYTIRRRMMKWKRGKSQ